MASPHHRKAKLGRFNSANLNFMGERSPQLPVLPYGMLDSLFPIKLVGNCFLMQVASGRARPFFVIPFVTGVQDDPRIARIAV